MKTQEAEKEEKDEKDDSGELGQPNTKIRRLAQLAGEIEEEAQLDFSFMALTVASCAIATFGLHQNSPAIVIGAMIISPLMHPLLALSLQIITANYVKARDVAITIGVGTLVSIVVSFFISLFLNSPSTTSEILSRTNPNILDLGVALFSGAIAAYARSDEKLAQSIAGVAISVALMPPLCVVGYEIAHGSILGALGAMLLFVTNLNGIILSACIVFLFYGYYLFLKSWEWIRSFSIATVILLIPLSLTFVNLYKSIRIEKQITEILHKGTITFKDVDIMDIDIVKKGKEQIATVTIISRKNITKDQVSNVQTLLRKRTKLRNLKLIIEAVPTFKITADD